MKTKILFLVLSSLIIYSCCDFENDEYTYQKNAKLERVLLYETIELNEPGYIIEEYSYDNKDRIKKVTCPQYDENSKIIGIVWYNEYYYNSKGQLSEIKNYNTNLNSSTGFINLRNYIYTYSTDGKKEKEYIEYPLSTSFEYSLFFYENQQLIKTEKYDNLDKLEKYIVYEYDDSGMLTKENLYFPSDNEPYTITVHKYVNGLNIKTDIFLYEDMKHAREIIRSFDKNDNLIILESNELESISSMMSHVLKYEYFEN